jgi:hypothetical protein
MTGIQNIVNDIDIPREHRNKLFNDLKGNEGLEINQRLNNNNIFSVNVFNYMILSLWHFCVEFFLKDNFILN